MPDIYEREGVWYGDLYYFDADKNRRIRVRRSTGIKTGPGSKARARVAAAEIERRLGVGLDRTKPKTLEKAFLERLEALKIRDAPRSTRKRAIHSAKNLFSVFGSDLACEDLTSVALRDYATYRLNAGATHDTVRREFSDLSAALTVAGQPLPSFPELPKPRVVERWLTADELRRLLEAAPPERARTIMLAIQTGTRKSEVFAVTKVAPGVGRLRGGSSLKTGPRTIPLTPVAEAILDAGPLQPWANQGRDLKRYAEAAGLGRVTWNDLRASTATCLLLNDIAPQKIAALLGHTSTRMIERRYARIASVGVSVSDLKSVSDMCQLSAPFSDSECTSTTESLNDLELVRNA